MDTIMVYFFWILVLYLATIGTQCAIFLRNSWFNSDQLIIGAVVALAALGLISLIVSLTFFLDETSFSSSIKVYGFVISSACCLFPFMVYAFTKPVDNDITTQGISCYGGTMLSTFLVIILFGFGLV